MKVSSPTSSESESELRKRWRAPLALLVLSIGLSLLLGGVTARADDLNDARDRVRKQIASAKKQISADASALAKAEERLRASEAALVGARRDLASVEARLTEARAADADLLVQLRAAEAQVTAAAAQEQAAEAKVTAQRDLIGEIARAAYQERSGLVGMAIVLGADTSRDVASRLHWSETVFDRTAADLDQLRQLESQAEAARRAVEDTKRVVAEKRARSAANLAATQKLADKAVAERARVTALVASNLKLRKAAQYELEVSKKQYNKLQAEEAKLTAKIKGDDSDYRNPNGFIKPVDAPAGSPFGRRYHPILRYWRMHWGTDFGAECGTPIRAMANGKVVQAGWTDYGFGYWTVISYGRMHGANLASGYAHQSKILVHVGQRVEQGQIVGYVGTTGLSAGCHLHLQVYRNGVRVDPMRYL